MSTPLRVFIGISIALHVALVGFIVIPSILGLFRPPAEPLSEEQVMLMKQRAAEKVAQEAARAEIRKELAKALKEDIRKEAGDLPPAKFEQLWTNSFGAVQSNLDATAAQLAKNNLSDLSPRELEDAMRGLRQAEIDALMAQLGTVSKDEIAAQVLADVAATLPEFNQKTRELMDHAESPKVRGEVDKLLAEEHNRRQKELAAANTDLTQAQQQVDQARTQSAAIGGSLAHTLGDNQKRTDAAARADASVEQALLAAAGAERHTAALDKAFAAKTAADENAAHSDALLADAGKQQAELEKALAGAQTVLQEAAAHAGQAKAVDARTGLAEVAVAVAATANDSVKKAATAIQGKDPAAASTASTKTAAALTDAARNVDVLVKSLAAAAASTNAAVAKSAAAALKSAASATNLLDKAITSAQAAAEASRQADEQRRTAMVAATEPSRGALAAAVNEARLAVDHALQTATDEKAADAKRTLRDTAAALAQVLPPSVAELERQFGRTNLAAAAEQAGKVATELDAAARKMDDEAAALAQEARDRKSTALAKDAAALSDATQTLRDAESKAQRTADAARDAASPAGVKRDAYAAVAKTDVTEAQDAIRTALEDASQAMRTTAAPLTDKAEKPVAEALAAAVRQTDAVANGPVKHVGELMTAGNAKAARQAAEQTHAALSNLVSDLSRTRGELAAMTGKPTVDEVSVAGAAHNSLEGVSKMLDHAETQLDKAADAADKGSELQASRAIGQAAKNVRETGETVVAHAADALAPKPADARIPETWPRPGRKEISIAQRDMDVATNRLSDLTREITAQKANLGGANSRFESNVVQTVDAALTEDPALREKTREFVRSTLREKVATEFREKTEALVENVLEKKGMEKDERFVRQVGQQAAQLLLSGSESNLLGAAFADMMGQTAKEFGVKPDELRKSLAEDSTDDDEIADDGKEPANADPDGKGKHKKKKRKDAGAEMAGAEAPGAGDDSGMAAVGKALEGSLAKALQSGAQNAIGNSAKTSLRLPDAGSFGESANDALRQRLSDARGGALRALSTGGRESFIAGMSQDFNKLGQSLKSGAMNGRRSGLYDNPEEYRRNLEAVIKGREVKEVVLVAPSLTSPVSAATAEVVSNRPALILVGSHRDLLHAPTNTAMAAERTLAPPEFKSFAYGGAPFATNPPTIDGDLSDWEGVKPFLLRGTLSKSEWRKPFPAEWETNRYLMAQWDYTGFYFAYKMADDEDNTDMDARNFWVGDCLELWFDFGNRRTDERSEDQQQFWFWPVGSRHLPGIIGGEAIMPGNRYEARFHANSTSPNDPKMAVKRTTNPRGYQVEIYLPLACFRKPDLTPGRIIAFNFSIHNGEGAYLRWTTELGKQESMTPSVWGDLVLLGSDARIEIVKPHKPAEQLAAIIPGEPLAVRLTDPDMNTDPHVRNQVKVKFESGEGHALTGYLQETDVNTGIFEGSIDTVEVLAGEEREVTNNALPVVSGGYVEVSYYDQARRYGEHNYTATKRVPVGVLVMRMAVRK
jgi:hypothetical protein